MKKTQGSLDSFLTGKAYSTKKTQLKIIPKQQINPKKKIKTIPNPQSQPRKKTQKNHKNAKIRQKIKFLFQKKIQKSK